MESVATFYLSRNSPGTHYGLFNKLLIILPYAVIWSVREPGQDFTTSITMLELPLNHKAHPQAMAGVMGIMNSLPDGKTL
jgi:hypothetical protein